VTVATLAYSAAFFGLLFTFVLFLTTVWGLSTVHAGLCISALAALVVPMSRRVGNLPQRIGFAPPLAGGVALIAVALLLATVVGHGHSFTPAWLAVLVVAGLGLGLCYPLLGAAAVARLPPADLAAATAINQCARQLGAALGVAVSVAALGSTSSPTAGRFHLAWLLCAALCAVSALSAITVDRRPGYATAMPR
jgi:predicted MFS family arabinose efflux permease